MRNRAAFALIGTGAFLTSLDNTIVGAAVPSMARDLALAPGELQWIGVAYMVPFAALLLATGAAVDRWGVRRAVGAGVGVFTAGTLLSGLADSAGVLLAGRVVQGAAAALLVPALLGLMRTGLAPRHRTTGAAVWTACLAAALAIGPVLGGLLSEFAGWRWVFWANLPFLAVMLVLLPRVGPTLRGVVPPDGRSPERTAGWWRRPLLRSALAVQTLWGLGITGIVFFTPLVHQESLGLGPLAAGLPLVLVAVGVVGAAPFVSAVVFRFGAHRAVGAGLVTVAVGLIAVAVAVVAAAPGVLPRVPGLVLVGIGSAFTTPLTTVPLDDVDDGRVGAVSAVLTVSRELSGALGIALVGAVLFTVGGSLTTGYAAALVLAAVLQLGGAALAVTTLRRPAPLPPTATTPSPAMTIGHDR